MIAMTTAAFLQNAARTGSPVGLATSPIRTYGTDAVVRRIDGAQARTLDGLYRAFARAWDFPDSFGFNKDAFDDAIRDLNPSLPTATGGRCAEFVTVVDQAPELLADAPAADFDWFAESIAFYRDAYRHDGRGFALILRCPESAATTVTRRWAAAGVDVVQIQD